MASRGVLLEGNTPVPTYRPAKPEITATKSSKTTSRPVVFRGKKNVIQECLSRKPSSSDRSAASSNTIKKYKSEITMTIHASIRQTTKMEVRPAAETKKVISTRTTCCLVSLLIVNLRNLRCCLCQKFRR